jgi:pimeloyl-[acyl-carrier protein] synthase
MTEDLKEVPQLDIQFTGPEFVADPWGTLEQIRAVGPVVYSRGPIGGDLAPADGYMIPGYATCQKVLGNLKTYRSVPDWFLNKFGGLIFEAFDESPHDEIRSKWANEFQRNVVREKYTDLIEEIVAQQIDSYMTRVKAGESPNAIADMHATIPLFVVLRLMGLDTTDHLMLAKWAHELSGVEVSEGAESLNSYLSGVVDERKSGDGSDLISLMARPDAKCPMNDRDVVANATQLVFAGAGTTTSLMSSCILLLTENPEQRDAVVDDRSLIPQMVEEVLRLRTVAQLAAPRVVTGGDAELEGYRIPEGATVVCLLGAANRDPDRWDDAARFDIFRAQRQHMAFGFGLHNCLGSSLARLEVEIYLNRLFDVLPDWRLTGPAKVHVDDFVSIDQLLMTTP